MAWITLNLRHKSLSPEVNCLELADMQYSRDIRQIQRHLSLEKAIINAAKKKEINEATKDYKELRDQREERKEDKDYLQELADAKEKAEEKKVDINDYYDMRNSEVEEEATDEENYIGQLQSTIEAQLEAIRNEDQVVKEQVSKDIQEERINLK